MVILMKKNENIVNLEVVPENIDLLVDSLFEQFDSKNLGVFISLLSNKYINEHKISKDEFMKSLSNSIDKLNNN